MPFQAKPHSRDGRGVGQMGVDLRWHEGHEARVVEHAEVLSKHVVDGNPSLLGNVAFVFFRCLGDVF